MAARRRMLAQAWEPEFKDGVLQPLPDGFPSEDLTLIVADDATSAEVILMQNLVETAAQYSPVGIRAEARDDFEAFGRRCATSPTPMAGRRAI